MSELELREFGARAEELVPLPDLTEIERRGHDLHRRRVAVVAAVAACVLAVAGLVTLRDDSSKSVEPVRPPDDWPVNAEEYPGATMQDLAPGTYWLYVSGDNEYPLARLTVPPGWNASEFPNRFDGHARGRTNQQAFDHLTWYAGAVAVEVEAVATKPCGSPLDGTLVDGSAADLVRAITRIPGYRVSATTESPAKFGYPATRLRLDPSPSVRGCSPEARLFATRGHGPVGGYIDHEVLWVVDVEGFPVLVDAQWSAGTPRAVRQQLTDIVDSIEFFFPS